jgi:hypothetical protein
MKENFLQEARALATAMIVATAVMIEEAMIAEIAETTIDEMIEEAIVMIAEKKGATIQPKSEKVFLAKIKSKKVF